MYDCLHDCLSMSRDAQTIGQRSTEHAAEQNMQLMYEAMRISLSNYLLHFSGKLNICRQVVLNHQSAFIIFFSGKNGRPLCGSFSPISALPAY